MKLDNLEDLRDHLLQTLVDLDEGEIELDQASIVAKLSEAIVSGIKTELEYARLINKEPNIPFLNKNVKNGKLLTNVKQLAEK